MLSTHCCKNTMWPLPWCRRPSLVTPMPVPYFGPASSRATDSFISVHHACMPGLKCLARQQRRQTRALEHKGPIIFVLIMLLHSVHGTCGTCSCAAALGCLPQTFTTHQSCCRCLMRRLWPRSSHTLRRVNQGSRTRASLTAPCSSSTRLSLISHLAPLLPGRDQQPSSVAAAVQHSINNGRG